MRKYIEFDCICNDSLAFNTRKIFAGQSYELFTSDDEGIEDKATDENEEQILKRLMSSDGGGLLLNKLQLSHNTLMSFSVRKPVVENLNYSDIDLILCESEFPEFSIGIQCKRVKVESLNEK